MQQYKQVGELEVLQSYDLAYHSGGNSDYLIHSTLYNCYQDRTFSTGGMMEI